MSDRYETLLELVGLEAEAQANRSADRAVRRDAAAAETSGESILDLVCRDEHAGLGGRTIVELVKRTEGRDLPWNRLGAGAPVVIASGDERVRGVVTRRSRGALQVAIDAPLPDELTGEALRVDLSSDEVTSSRQSDALRRLVAIKSGRLADLKAVVDGVHHARLEPLSDVGEVDRAGRLNARQVEAVQTGLRAADFALIHGPPGTGKTWTVVELIVAAVERGERVLATAPSNLAVDNVLERLVARGVSVVRLGHPARVLSELVEHTLDLQVQKHESVRLARKLVNQAFTLRRDASRWTRGRPEADRRRTLRAEARALLADARRLEAQAIEAVLDGADVVCGTTSLDERVLGDRRFDLVVIDEAAQSTEPGSWLPLMRGDRVVLAGDHQQLPPTVISGPASRRGLAVSLFERLVDLDVPRVRLDVQYRMHEAIMTFSSDELYDADLVAAPLVAEHRLCDLDGVEDQPLTQAPFEFLDTAGAGHDEAVEADGESRFNDGEITLVSRRVDQLLSCGVRARDIGIIAPYAAQVRRLRERIDAEGVEIDTVDGFQGREKEAIIVTLVRSNPDGAVGFLAEVRRMNVAMTRARRKLIIIGDSATVGGHAFYGRLLAYAEAIEGYRTVWEEA